MCAPLSDAKPYRRVKRDSRSIRHLAKRYVGSILLTGEQVRSRFLWLYNIWYDPSYQS